MLGLAGYSACPSLCCTLRFVFTIFLVVLKQCRDPNSGDSSSRWAWPFSCTKGKLRNFRPCWDSGITNTPYHCQLVKNRPGVQRWRQCHHGNVRKAGIGQQLSAGWLEWLWHAAGWHTALWRALGAPAALCRRLNKNTSAVNAAASGEGGHSSSLYGGIPWWCFKREI